MTTAQAGSPAKTPEAPRRRRMTWRTWLLVGLAGAVVLGGAGVGTFLLLRPTSASQAATSRTAEVERGTQTLTVSLDGTLSPRKQSSVDFAVSGTVTKVYVDAGEKVGKGDRLARVDDEELQNAVDLAQANLTTALANLDDAYDSDASSAAITSAKAQVSSARAALAAAEEDLDDAVLRAPILGTVAAVGIEVGDSVGSSSAGSGGSGSSSTESASSAAFTIIATAKWKLEASIGASDLGSVKAGQEVVLSTDATTDELTGTVASVGIVATSTSDDGTATFPVEITIDGTHTDLYSGTTATAVITTGSYDDVLTVPTAALRTENGATVVTRIVDEKASTVEVEVGRVFGSVTEVTSGLAEGDTVQITIVRQTTTTTETGTEQGGLGMGFGGLTGGPPGGGAPPAGGGQGGNR